jgi:hypothetical protein
MREGAGAGGVEATLLVSPAKALVPASGSNAAAANEPSKYLGDLFADVVSIFGQGVTFSFLVFMNSFLGYGPGFQS